MMLEMHSIVNQNSFLETETIGDFVRIISREGDRYGRLVVLERAPNKSKKDTNARWLCRCDCGMATIAYGQDLERDRTKSCGCLNAENRYQHGMSHKHVYAVWQAMLQRCENPKSQSWGNYGCRGIFVCDEWHDFVKFYADMGDRPKGYSLDRTNNDGPYSKENCQWVLMDQQANNKRNNRVIEFSGETKTLAEWAKQYGLEWSVLRSRIDYWKWPMEKALTEPMKETRSYEFDGKKLTLRQWSVASGIGYETLSARVRKLKWTIDRALTEPVASKGLNQ